MVRAVAVVLDRVTTAFPGASAPHPVQASSQAPIIAVFARPLTTSPRTLAARGGHPAPNAGSVFQPLPVGHPAWHVAPGVSWDWVRCLRTGRGWIDRGYDCSGTGIECHSTSFQAPLSRRRINVVGAEMCCEVPFIV